MKVFEYYKSKLNVKDKKIYELLLKEFKSLCFDISIEGQKMDDVSNVYKALFLDHPELYYLSSETLFEEEEVEYTNGTIKHSTNIKAKDLYPGEIKNEIIKRFNLAVRRIKSILPENPNKLEIEIAIIKYITRICIEENNDELNQNAASCLAFGKAQCSGYAKAFSLLMNKFGIDTFVAIGEALNYDTNTYEPHTWNIIKLGEEYYHVDIEYALNFRLINKTLNLEYFNIPDKEIKKTHRWDEKYPLCLDNKFIDFKHKEPINNKPINRINV